MATTFRLTEFYHFLKILCSDMTVPQNMEQYKDKLNTIWFRSTLGQGNLYAQMEQQKKGLTVSCKSLNFLGGAGQN